MDDRMNNPRKSVLVTGATAGIGRATVLHLAKETDWHVFAAGRDQDKLDKLTSEAGSDTLHPVLLDVTDHLAIQDAHQQIIEQNDGYGVDVLVNNAGYSQPGPLEYITDAQLKAQFDTNVFGLLEVTRTFLGEMKKRRSGRIINISSIAGGMTYPIGGPYCMTKHAVESLSDALRLELRQFGIRVVIIQPGPISTPFFDAVQSKTKQLSQVHADNDSYRDAIRRSENIMIEWGAKSPGPKVVAKKIHHVINVSKPKARYIVPFRDRLRMLAFHALPTVIADRILLGMFELR